MADGIDLDEGTFVYLKNLASLNPTNLTRKVAFGEFGLALLAEVERLRAVNERLAVERDLAVAHDSQPYPTAWAYERACELMHARTAERDAALARIRAVEQRCNQVVEENRPPNAVNSEVVWLAGDIRAALAAPTEDSDHG